MPATLAPEHNTAGRVQHAARVQATGPAAGGQIKYPGYALPPIPRRPLRVYRQLMASFLVFRDLPGVTRDQYAAAQNAAAEAARSASATGREVTYLGGFFLPGTGRAICVFHAESAADVTAVNRQAGVPVADVVEAIDLRAPGGRLSASARGSEDANTVINR